MKERFNDKDFYNNGFDLIRYWAAISVMIGHYIWKFAEFSNESVMAFNIVNKIVSFFPGVVIFFAISGYLITASLERSKSNKEYLIKRVARMYPELWVCTLVNFVILCFVAFPLFDKSIVIWLGTQIFGIANTPGCLANFATGSVNGSLWTIFTEIQFYIIICFINKFLKKLSNIQWGLLLTVFATVNVAIYYLVAPHTQADKIISRTFIPYFVWFLIGSFMYHKREVLVPVIKKLTLPMFVIYLLFSVFKIKTPGYYAGILAGILVPLMSIGFAYLLPKIRIKCDLTYGIFLYHWIVLNVIVHFDLMNKLHWFSCLAVFVVATLMLSWLSWRFVGKPSGKITKKLVEKYC